MTIKLSKNRVTFAAENFKVRNWVVIYQKTSLIIEKSERAKRAGKFFWWFYCINDILIEKVRIVKVRKMAKIRNRYNQVPHLTQDTTWESNTTTINITNKSQEVSPFPAGDHKAAWTDAKAWQSQDINNTNDPQKKYHLGTVSKNILLEGLNQFHSANLSSDVDQDT